MYMDHSLYNDSAFTIKRQAVQPISVFIYMYTVYTVKWKMEGKNVCTVDDNH